MFPQQIQSLTVEPYLIPPPSQTQESILKDT